MSLTASWPTSGARAVCSVDEYRQQLMGLVQPLAETVQVPIGEALGRAVAAPVRAHAAIPAWDNSAMDGYALRWADVEAHVPVTVPVVADVAAGSSHDPALLPGQCARIMTGAPVPSDADTVIPVELTEPHAHTVTINDLPMRGRGAHIRRAGEDAQAGKDVVQTGTVLSPQAVAALAATGVGSVTVRRAPVVMVAATGDELIMPGAQKPLLRGQIFESNTAYLAAAAQRLGAQVRRADPLPDQVQPFLQRLRERAAGADLVVLTGGVSVGAYDVVRQALEGGATGQLDEHAQPSGPASQQMGMSPIITPAVTGKTAPGTQGEGADWQGQFVQVRMQPGKPQGYAPAPTSGLPPLVCLPGNPVSVVVSFALFIAPMLARLQAMAPVQPRMARVSTGWKSPAGKQQLLPVRTWVDEHATLCAEPAHAGGSASHMVTRLAGADALAQVDEHITEVNPGDVLPVWSLP